jgi:hypothetical protein
LDQTEEFGGQLTNQNDSTKKQAIKIAKETLVSYSI